MRFMAICRPFQRAASQISAINAKRKPACAGLRVTGRCLHHLARFVGVLNHSNTPGYYLVGVVSYPAHAQVD